MRAIARLGVREINFNLEIYCNEHDAAVTATALQIERRALAMEVKADPRASAAARLEQAVVRVEQAGRDLGMEVTFEPSVPRHQLASLLAGTIRETAFLSCRELTNLRIDPAGNVLPCGFIRKPFGNLLEQSLEDIWNGEAFRQFRIMLLGDNLLPACKRCCKLAVVSGKQDGASEKGSASYH